MVYVVDPLSGVTEQWILDHVVPNLTKKVTPEVAKVLGRAVLFRVFDSSGEVAFPPHRREQILEAYSDLGYRINLWRVLIPLRGSHWLFWDMILKW